MPTLQPTEAEFVKTAPQRTVVERAMRATPAAIWKELVDTESWPTWFPGMSRAESTSAVREGVGSARAVKIGPLLVNERFVIWEPEKVWGFVVTKSNLPIAKRMLEQVELIEQASSPKASTLVRYTGAFEPYPIAKVFFGITRKQVTTAWTNAFEALARRVESAA